MSPTGRLWTSQELYDLCQRRRDLYPREVEYYEGGWYLARGPRHDYEVGARHVQLLVLREVNSLLQLSGSDAFTDLDAAVGKLERREP